MLTLDANVFAAALSPTHIYFTDSLALLAGIRPEQLLVVCPTLILPECTGAITRPTGRVSLAQSVLAYVQSLPNVRLREQTAPGSRRTLQSLTACAEPVPCMTPSRRSKARRGLPGIKSG